MDPQKILLYPLMGEKATYLRENENKLSFVVDKNSTKQDIKKAVESNYNVKVLKVDTLIAQGRKKAHIKLDQKYSAEEITSRFGVL